MCRDKIPSLLVTAPKNLEEDGGGQRVDMLVQWVDRATQVVFFLFFVIF